jgi:phosphoribosylamine--glycine ligase
MKLLIIDSKHMHGLDLALRAMQDGHDVVWFGSEHEKTRHIGKGLVHIVREFQPWVNWADLIFLTDNTTHLRNIDALRKQGYPIIGPTSESAEWELDRCVGIERFASYGIEVPAYEEFHSYDDAVAYVKKHDCPFVSKPSGDADKALSYVAKHPADLIYMLERWKSNRTLKGGFILQQKIEGIEMAVGGWIGPNGFNDVWCENFEFKKLCTGDLGCSTGEQGTVLRYVKDSKLARKILLPLEEEIVEVGHTGYIDVNCIIDAKGRPWPLEFTMRPGWPTFNIQQELHEGDCAEWMLELISGEDSHNASTKDVALGVVVSIPDYPYSHITRKEVTGIPIYLSCDDLSHIHFCEVMACKGPHPETYKPVDMYGTAGDYVLVVSAKDKTVVGAKRQVYSLLKQIEIPNSPMWRVDIGDRLRKELPILQKHGYATGLDFAPAKITENNNKQEEDSLQVGDLKVLYV